MKNTPRIRRGEPLLDGLFGRRDRQRVTPFVFRMSRMPLDPLKGDLMPVEKVQKPLPQVWIQGRFLIGALPAPGPPALGPALCNRVDKIFGCLLYTSPSPRD